MTTTAVFVKNLSQDLSPTLDLTSTLLAGEIVVSVSIATISPVTSPAMSVAAVPTTDGKGVLLNFQTGVANTSYGCVLTVFTSTPRALSQPIAVYVAQDLLSPYDTADPYSFRTTVDEIPAGESVIGKGVFFLAPGTDASQGYVTWTLLGDGGVTFATGNGFDYRILPSNFFTQVEAQSVVHVPSDIPATLDGNSYQLRWELHLPGLQDQYAFESIRVSSKEGSVPTGPSDALELAGDPILLSIVVPRLYDNVGFEIFLGNIKEVNYTPVGNPTKVSSGWLYQISIQTSPMTANLEAYTVAWKYWNNLNTGSVFRETSSLFLFSPSLLQAIDDVKRRVSKARTTLTGFPDMIFESSDIAAYLRRGRDYFNAAGGLFTNFDMSNATGAIREYWLQYTEVALLEAQALAEGEKAFDFQGQAISLNTEQRAQAYQSAADQLSGRLNTDVRPLKQNLQMRGFTQGDGDVTSIPGNRPRVGITISQLSQFGRWGTSRFYGF